MPFDVGLSHIVRNADRISTGSWNGCELKSAFQPIFAFRGGRLGIAAYEGLLRPFRGDDPLSPAVFLGALSAPDRLPLEILSRTLHLLNAGTLLPREASIFLNFDPSVITDKTIAENVLRDLRQVVHEAGVEPVRVVCEITEQRLSSETGLFHFIAALRANGFRIAVDDYGAEDSNAERVRYLKPDIVKFDAKWITQLMASGPGFGLLAAMVENFAGQGIVTVFEGIEENWQLDLAERAGASMVQGYVLARPEIASPTLFQAFAGIRAETAEIGEIRSTASVSEDRPAAMPRGRAARTFGRRVVAS